MSQDKQNINLTMGKIPTLKYTLKEEILSPENIKYFLEFDEFHICMTIYVVGLCVTVVYERELVGDGSLVEFHPLSQTPDIVFDLFSQICTQVLSECELPHIILIEIMARIEPLQHFVQTTKKFYESIIDETVWDDAYLFMFCVSMREFECIPLHIELDFKWCDKRGGYPSEWLSNKWSIERVYIWKEASGDFKKEINFFG